MTKEQPSTDTRAEITVDQQLKAFMDAAVVEALARPDTNPTDVPDQLKELYDSLHKKSILQSYAGIRFAFTRIQALTSGQKTPFDKGFLEALTISTERRSSGSIKVVKDKPSLIYDLGVARARLIKITKGGMPGDPLEFEGKIAGLEWVLGYKDFPEDRLSKVYR